MKSFLSVLFKLVLLGLMVSPFLVIYWFLVDPVNCLTNLIGVWLWVVMVVVPIILVSLVLWGVFLLLSSVFSDLVNLFKR